jgi:N-acetyl-gamma-glutamylphosphate reductase
MKALIIGATGATGKDLVKVLLDDPTYTEVVAFVRRSSGLLHSKYSEVITDFDKLEEVSDFIKGDV